MDAAALPLPHRILGEEVGLVVHVKPDWIGKITDQEVIAHCKTRLAPFKVPVYVELRTEEFPKNANGKTLKKDMKEEVVKNAAAKRGPEAKL